MADKPQESPASRSRTTRGAIPPADTSPGRGGHDIEVARRPGEREAGAGRETAGRMRQMASAMVGGALLTMGLQSRSLGGAAMAIAGGGLIYRGTRGRTLAGRVPGLRIRRAVVSGAPAAKTVLERSITIQKPASELYRLWRVAENLSKVMGHFADVTTTGPDLQHWKVQGPFGRTLEWDSHVVEEHPGEFLRWESVEGAELPNEGWVRFRPAPADWGTVVTLRFRFQPPGGALGDAAMKLLGGVPTTLAHKTLKRFKSLVETGEIATTRHNPAAREGGYAD